MWNMLTRTFEFLSEKARGLLLTLGGTGVGTLPEVIQKTSNVVTENELTALQDIQLWAYRASFIVALLTIISYGYKFILFIQTQCKCYRTKRNK